MLRYQYDTNSGEPYSNITAATPATAGNPAVVVVNGLTANTKYYYRMQYSTDGGTTWTARSEHSFWTKRAQGSTYAFTITSDAHVNILLGNATTWTNTMNDVAADQPDLHIDLGDTIAMRGLSPGDTTGAENAYKYALPFFNTVSASSPIFLAPGNHEQQEAWHLLSPLADSLPVIGTNAQKKFFLNPVPDGSFYTGDTSTLAELSGDDLKQDYYSWTWGDALFVVINPYWYSTTKPYVSDPGGGETDTTGSGDSWDWTLGLDQFNWLKSTLQNSGAKYKFVFAHQMVSGGSISGQADYGHGGANYANLCEWGGYNEDGTTLGWSTRRAGWGSLPIHQLMVANDVTAFFHGHDHQYAYEMLDGIVYQSVPSAGFTGNGFSMYTTGDENTIQALSSSGHLKVTVGPAQATVDYIRTGEASSSYSYTMAPNEDDTVTLTLKPGWNLVAAATGTATFPSSLFGWNGSSYTPTSAPASWQGYWYNNETGVDQTVEIQTDTASHIIDLSNGWNLIGNPLGSTASLSSLRPGHRPSSTTPLPRPMSPPPPFCPVRGPGCKEQPDRQSLSLRPEADEETRGWSAYRGLKYPSCLVESLHVYC